MQAHGAFCGPILGYATWAPQGIERESVSKRERKSDREREVYCIFRQLVIGLYITANCKLHSISLSVAFSCRAQSAT